MQHRATCFDRRSFRRQGERGGYTLETGHDCPERLGGRGVSREERLDRELGQRDVNRRPEHRRRAEEGQGVRPNTNAERHGERGVLVGRRAAVRLVLGGEGVARHLTQQLVEDGVAADGDLVTKAGKEVPPPFREVDDLGGEAGRVEAEPDHIHWWLEQHRVHRTKQRRNHPVRGKERPVAVDGNRRRRLVACQNQLDGPPGRCQLGRRQRLLRKDGRVAGRQQQGVLLAQRDLELPGEPEQHDAAGGRAAGLQKAQMAGGDLRVESECELAEASPLAPQAEQLANWLGGCGLHGLILHSSGAPGDYPRGNVCLASLVAL